MVEEDREQVLREMALSRIVEQLDKHGVHVLYGGIIDPVRGYTRKRVEYRYCDDDHRMVIMVRTDITDIYEQERQRNIELQRALELAYTDQLTGLLNQHGFSTKAQQLLNECWHERAALFFIDLDNFKAVNDTYGHLVGDILLQKVANIIKNNIRSTDLAGRYGGDEFMVFIARPDSKQSVEEIAQRICAGIDTLKYMASAQVKVTCSLGVVVAPDDISGSDYAQMVFKADNRLYAAKHLGKNMVVSTDCEVPEEN